MTAASTPTAASEHDIAVDPAPLHKAGVNPEHIRIGGRQIERLLFLFFGRQLQRPLRHPLRAIPCNRKKGFECCLKAFLLQISRIRQGIASPSQSAGTVRYGMPECLHHLPHLFIGKPRSARSSEHLAAAIMRIGKYPDFHVSSPSFCRLQPRVRPCSPDARCRSAPAAGIPAEKCRPRA